MKSPSLPTTGTALAATLCPSTTSPVGGLSDGLGMEDHRGGPGSPHAQDLILSDPLASRLHEAPRLWAGPLYLSPQWVQVLGMAKVQILQHEWHSL